MPFRSFRLPVFWAPDLESPRPGEAIPSFRPGWLWNLVLLLPLLTFSIHVVGETWPPSSPSSYRRGQEQLGRCLQEEAGALNSRAAVSVSNPCCFLSGPSLPLPGS